jgi:hypothetical protein
MASAISVSGTSYRPSVTWVRISITSVVMVARVPRRRGSILHAWTNVRLIVRLRP